MTSGRPRMPSRSWQLSLRAKVENTPGSRGTTDSHLDNNSSKREMANSLTFSFYSEKQPSRVWPNSSSTLCTRLAFRSYLASSTRQVIDRRVWR